MSPLGGEINLQEHATRRKAYRFTCLAGAPTSVAKNYYNVSQLGDYDCTAKARAGDALKRTNDRVKRPRNFATLCRIKRWGNDGERSKKTTESKRAERNHR